VVTWLNALYNFDINEFSFSYHFIDYKRNTINITSRNSPVSISSDTASSEYPITLENSPSPPPSQQASKRPKPASTNISITARSRRNSLFNLYGIKLEPYNNKPHPFEKEIADRLATQYDKEEDEFDAENDLNDEADEANEASNDGLLSLPPTDLRWNTA
jgi:hypothetical protein